jgi:hypothetical protein
MGLVQVATNTITSSVNSFELTGIDSDDVYALFFHNVSFNTDAKDISLRVLESGTPNTTTNYDQAFKLLRTDTTFSNSSSTNANNFDVTTAIGNDTGETSQGIIYIYNAFNSSEFTFFTLEQCQISHTALFLGKQGGAVFTSASQVNGIQILGAIGSSSFRQGTFTLFKVI